MRMEGDSGGGRVGARDENGRACVRCVFEERESLSSAGGGETSAVVGSA